MTETETETLTKISDLLVQIELLNPHTLGLDTSVISDFIDEVNFRLNPDLLDD